MVKTRSKTSREFPTNDESLPMRSLMLSQMFLQFKPRIAQFTLEGPLVRMHRLMTLQHLTIDKRFAAFVAPIITFAAMPSQMLSQYRTRIESLPANHAQMLTFVAMQLLVHEQRRRMGELFTAQIANVGLLARMYTLMLLHVALLRKPFTA